MDTLDSIRRAEPLLGTFVEIAGAGVARQATIQAIEAAFAAVARVHRLMSFHDPQSDVSRLNREAVGAAVVVDPLTVRVLEAAIALHRTSGGSFDIAVAPVLQRRGLLPCPAGEPSADTAANGTSAAIELLDGNRVRFHHCLRIDLGGIAKGFAVDRALDILREREVPQGLVNAGGDLAVFGPRAETVHVRDPRDPRLCLCQIAVSNAALASSAGAFDPLADERPSLPAIIDPATREPARKVVGVTVRASCCMIADALTKVVMIGAERAAAVLEQYDAGALLVLDGGEIRLTADWRDAISAAA